MSKLKPFSEINQTDTAKRKLKNIAKNNNLPLEFVTTLYNFNWDLDPVRPTESYGWVSSEQYTEEQFKQAKKIICKYLDIDLDFKLSKEEIIKKLIKTYNDIDERNILNRFLIGGENKNNTYVSEYATFHYLKNLTENNLLSLGSEETYDTTDIFHYIFLKIFRGGCIERYNLFYVFTDLFFKLPFVKKEEKYKNEWHSDLIKTIEKYKPNTLTDLIKSCKGLIKGDKYFKQMILEALSYSGELKVKDIHVENIFIPNFRNELASNFYSNEWSYPLRMWNENK
ncbi:MAG: hypothetical protein KGV44_06755 [Flavobacteriaceae bacterium]|nr:hypothetical protein [Flavobacteriaceae bacterium]